jgi:hypothetical protein
MKGFLMSSDYQNAIDCIIRFKKSIDKFDPKIPNKLVGDIGEFYALCELQRKGFSVIHKGGQAGFDIYLNNLNKRIEVRTSLLKNEGVYPKEILFYGWRVKNRNQKKEKKFDILIAVGLDDTFTKPRFYLFTYKEAFSVGDVNIGRFKNVQKKIHVFKNENLYKAALKSKPALVTKFERYINQHQSEFLNNWKKLKD